MSSSKKRVINCKARGEKVLQIFESKKSAVDVGEFTTTIKFLISVLSEYLDTKSNFRPQCNAESKHLEGIMVEYSEFLEELIKIERFLRFFTSNRVRKRLDHINTQIYKDATEIYLELQQQKAKAAKKGSNIKKSKEAPPYAAELEKLSSCFRDDEARNFWESNFEQAFMISWDRFIAALKQTIHLDNGAVSHLQYILDNSNTGYLSMSRFSDFLNGFGPLRQCSEKVESILNAEWFHGFLSSTETERLLDRQPSGTFLIRFSKSKPGSFAIGYVEGDPGQKLKVTHTLISCAPPSGFKIEEAYNRNARGRLFATLFEVVEFYNYLLKFTLRSDLSRLSWFHGDLSAQEADELLGNAENGSYLVRFSTTAGYLAVSYVREKSVNHALLECLQSGYRYDNKPHIYKTLTEMVNDLSDTLKHPLSNLTYELNPAFQKQVVFNSADGEATLAPVVPKNAPGSGNYGSISEIKSYAPPPTSSSPTHSPQSSNNSLADPRLTSLSTPPPYASVELFDPQDDLVKPHSLPSSSSATNSHVVPPVVQSNYMSMPQSYVNLPNASPSPSSPAPQSNYGSLPSPAILSNASPSPSIPAPQSNYGTLPGPLLTSSSSSLSNSTSALPNLPPPSSSLLPPATAVPQSNYSNLPTPGLLVANGGTGLPNIPSNGLSYSLPPSYGNPLPSFIPPYVPSNPLAAPAALSPQSNYGSISFALPNYTNALPSSPTALPSSLPPTSNPPPQSNYGSIPSTGIPAAAPVSSTSPASYSLPTFQPPTGIPGSPVPYYAGSSIPNNALPNSTSSLPPVSNYGSIPTSVLPSILPTSYPSSIGNNALPTSVAPQISNYGSIPSSVLPANNLVGGNRLPSATLPSSFGSSTPAPNQSNYGSIPSTLAKPSTPASPPPSQYGSIPSTSVGTGGKPTLVSNVSSSPVQKPRTGTITSPSQSNYGSIPSVSASSSSSKKEKKEKKEKEKDSKMSSPPSPANYGSIPTTLFKTPGSPPSKKN